MTALREIRDALKSRLDTFYAGSGVQVYDTVPGSIEGPCVIVEPDAGDYHGTMGDGFTEHVLAVHVATHLGDRESAQDKIDTMIAPNGTLSVKAGIKQDATLGGVVKYADVQRYRDYGTRRYGDADYLMATVEVTVLSS